MEKLYPNSENNKDLSAEQFIHEIENIANVENIVVRMIEILRESIASRGRSIVSASRMPSQSEIITHLTNNILIIQMSKIPDIYITTFNQRYRFTTYDIGVTHFENLIAQPSSSLPIVVENTKSHSANDVFYKKTKSTKTKPKSV